ncbi:MAG: hypothetical protein KDI79_26950 [Anaerolineae bacterium]|nr:hypothetical protein [Anaerolineae bacterium]
MDEQLLGRNLEVEIARWYRGTIQFIVDLRPNTVIKDDAIPEILRQQNQPTFVTINERDFWGKVKIDNQFCVVCFTLSDAKANEIPDKLRAVMRPVEFKTKANRMGKVIRVTAEEISYYTVNDRQIRSLEG